MGSSEQHTASTDEKRASVYEAASPMQNAIRWFREKVAGKPEGTLKEMIAEALDEDSEATTALSADERNLLKNMIHFGELTVSDIMVPRSDILAVAHDATADEWKRYVIDIGHTRIPVYEDKLDKVLGFVHVKDLFLHAASDLPFDINRIIREILFVPPSMRIVDLLMKMRVSGCHIAIVVDEYGGTDGLVTMEDLFEELVGEIQDEHDSLDVHMMHWVGDQILEADARAKIDDVEAALKEKFTEGIDHEAEYETLGGFIFSHLGRVPVKGEVVKLNSHLKIEILAADPRRVRQVRITRASH
jgi:CBS domain containing-hemolysin-like protein